MMKKVTIGHVAEHAGVSKSTVSQFLNKRFDYMSTKTKQKIEQSIKELDYKPNIIARSLKVKQTTTIGVVVANILHEFSTQIIRSIEKVCHQSGFQIIVCNADDQPEKEQKHIQMLLAKQVDGIIAFPTGGNIELYGNLSHSNFPIVFIDRYLQDIPISTVLLNNESASYLAVEKFQEKNLDQIGIITTSLDGNISPRVERVEGFRKAMNAYNLPIREELICSVDIEFVQDTLHRMMQLKQPPNALLLGNDRVLLEALKYIRKNHINIPDELAIIGVDDVAFADIFNPPITTIEQPTFEIGKKAADLLLKNISSEESERKAKKKLYRFEPQLIERKSC